QLVDIGLEVLFLLPAVLVEVLPEIPLPVEQTDAYKRNIQVRRALDVVAGEYAQSTGIDGNRLVQPEFGREVRHGMGPQDARMPRSPSSVLLQILPLAAIGVVDPAVQHQLRGALLKLRQGNFPEQRDRVVIELDPTRGIEVEEQVRGIVVPAPPQIPGQRPEPLLRGRDEAVESAGLAHHRRYLGGRLHQHPNLVFVEDARLDGLYDENTLQDAAIDQRNSEERLVAIFVGLFEMLEAGMAPRPL